MRCRTLRNALHHVALPAGQDPESLAWLVVETAAECTLPQLILPVSVIHPGMLFSPQGGRVGSPVSYSRPDHQPP